jgi:ABC-type transport system involved in multi-copper enzyme maturation permease subunit
MAAVEAPPPFTRSLRERLSGNPIVLKEMRGRMRGNRAFLVIVAYLTLMSLFALMVYVAYTLALSQNAYDANLQIAGKVVFGSVVGIELFLVCFIAPAFTAGAISGERERQTYELLRTTLMPARSLVLGKLTSALSFIILLLFLGLPVQSLAFLLGGVAPEEILISLAILLATALAAGSSGIFFSALMRRTLGASVLTYAFALVVMIGLPALGLFIFWIATTISFYNSSLPPLAQTLVMYIFIYLLWALASLNPLAAGFLTELSLMSGYGNAFVFVSPYGNGPPNGPTAILLPWVPYVLICLFFSMMMVLFSIQIVRRREHA